MNPAVARCLKIACLFCLVALTPALTRSQAVTPDETASQTTTADQDASASQQLAAATTPSSTPAPAKASSGASKTSDEVVELSEFQVSAKSQTGYIASESMTGTRLPTKVMDLPFTMDITTSEFLDDFAVIDESSIIDGGVVTGDQDSGGVSTIRGIKSSGQLVNGFWQPAGMPLPTAMKDRIETLKGPNAGIYGQTSPGGMRNTITKQAKFNLTSTKLKLQYGNYNQLNGSLEVNLPLMIDTALLLAVTGNDRQFTQKWRENTNWSVYADLRHKLSSTAQLTLDFTYTGQHNKAPANRVPYNYNSTYPRVVTYTPAGTDSNGNPWPIQTFSGTGYYTGWNQTLRDTTGTGPNSWADTDAVALFATFEKRINSVFSYRLGGDYMTNHVQSFNTTALTVYDGNPAHIGTDPYSSNFYGLNRIRSASSSYSAPGYQKDNQDAGGLQGDLLARYFMFNKKVECSTLLTFDYSSRYEYIEKWSMPQRISKANADGSPSTSNAPDPSVFPWDPTTIGTTVSADYFWANYWVPIVDPLTDTTPYVNEAQNPQYDIYHTPNFDKNKWILRSGQKSRRDILGLMLRQKVTLFNKLIIYGGVRFDNVTYNYNTGTYPSWSPKFYPQYASWWSSSHDIKKWHSSNWTPSVGFNYRAVRWLALYGNYSSSFNPSGQPVSGATTGTLILPNEKAWGYDYGVKFSLLNERLLCTVGGFYVNQYNVSVTAEDPNSALSYKQAVGNVLSRGIEVSANYNITSELSIKPGYWHTNAIWVYAGSDKDLNGRSRAAVPSDLAQCAAKYTFRNGLLKGLSVFGLYQYTGSSPSDEGGGGSITPKDPAHPGKNLPSFTPVGSNNGLRDLNIPSVYTIDLGASYQFRWAALGSRTRHSLQINIKNITNKEYITLSRGVADKCNVIGTYTVAF